MAVYQVRSAVECTSPGHGCRLRGLRARAMMDFPAAAERDDRSRAVALSARRPTQFSPRCATDRLRPAC